MLLFLLSGVNLVSRQYDERHRSVMIRRLHYLLGGRLTGTYVDCTAGEGGHIGVQCLKPQRSGKNHRT